MMNITSCIYGALPNKMTGYNPWHGCHKISEGCKNCFIYTMDQKFGRDASVVVKTSAFDLPLRKDRKGHYKVLPEDGVVYTCFSSDFFIEEADDWRKEVWSMIRTRSDLDFFIITKRIDRFRVSLPEDWNEGYDNVIIASTCENQDRLDYRMPIFLDMPIKHREIVCEPLLGPLRLVDYLKSGLIEAVSVGGESGLHARVCDYDWVLDIRWQCESANVPFVFRQTGANFRKDGKFITSRKGSNRAKHAKAISISRRGGDHEKEEDLQEPVAGDIRPGCGSCSGDDVLSMEKA